MNDFVPVSEIKEIIIPDTPEGHRLIDLLRELAAFPKAS